MPTDPPPATHLDPLAVTAYAHGADPMDWAESLIDDLMTEHCQAIDQEANGLPLPAGWPDTCDDTFARKVLGALLDAGWTAPEGMTR